MPTGHGCNTGWATGFWIRLAHKRAGRGDSGTHPREKRTSASRLGRNICLSGRDLGLACLDVSRRGQPDYDARMIARQHKADGAVGLRGSQRLPFCCSIGRPPMIVQNRLILVATHIYWLRFKASLSDPTDGCIIETAVAELRHSNASQAR